MPSVPPELLAVAPVASYRLRRATQIRALVWSALYRWNVAHRASRIAGFSCVPPCAVEMNLVRCGRRVNRAFQDVACGMFCRAQKRALLTILAENFVRTAALLWPCGAK